MCYDVSACTERERQREWDGHFRRGHRGHVIQSSLHADERACAAGSCSQPRTKTKTQTKTKLVCGGWLIWRACWWRGWVLRSRLSAAGCLRGDPPGPEKREGERRKGVGILNCAFSKYCWLEPFFQDLLPPYVMALPQSILGQCRIKTLGNAQL